MTSPLAAFLEGLTGGFQGGTEFRHSRDERRRRRTLEDEERSRRNFERGRGDAERAQETGIEYLPSRAPNEVGRFDEAADRLRRGVGAGLMPQTPGRPGGTAFDEQRQTLEYRHFGDEVAVPRIRGIEDRIQFGGFEKVRPSAAEQRENETAFKEADLAAAVGNELARTRPELGIRPGSREAMLLGMGKLPNEAQTWEPRTRDEQLQWLRDTGVISQRTRAGRSAAGAEQRADLASVERQVDDTRADLARAERDAPERGPLTEAMPAAESKFRADSAASARRLADLRARSDSLGRVRDSIAGEVQGRPPARTVTRTPAEWVAEVRRAHPDWTPEQVATEARRRAGAR